MRTLLGAHARVDEPTLDAIRVAAARGALIFGPRARREMAKESPSLLPAEIQQVVPACEVIEDYPDDPRGACCLISGASSRGRSVHVVVTAPRPEVFVVTAYVPSQSRWEDDFRRRRQGGDSS